MPGLSIANNLLANDAQVHLEKNQALLQTAVTQLSSGLRINSAADDPSGLAISTNLQTQVDAFHQASQNVQDANNAARVADGALSKEVEILQRMRSLAVQASSSVNSTSDLQNLQTEISQLILEINRISENTNFNGTALLDGTHAGYVPSVHASYDVSNAVLASDQSSASVGSGITNGDMSSPSEPVNTLVPGATPAGWTFTGTHGLYNGAPAGGLAALPAGQQAAQIASGATMSQTVTGLTPGATYTLSYQAASTVGGVITVNANGTISTPAVTSTWQTFSTMFTADASGNATIEFDDTFKHVDITGVSISAAALPSSALNLVAGVTPVTSGPGTIFDSASGGAVDGTIQLQAVVSNGVPEIDVTFFDSASGTLTTYAAQFPNTAITVDGLMITLGNATLADAGTTAYIKIHQAAAASTSASGPLTIQSGANEGDTVQVGVQATNAQTLRISNINLANSASAVLAAEDAIGQIDFAIDTLNGQRAQLGAVIVALNEDANNDNVAAVNLQASESAIRDLNVGHATTEFTRLQVLVQAGTSVLAQSNSNAQSILGLFR